MKTRFPFFIGIVCAICLTMNTQAAKWRVNNNPAVDADFYDLATAYDNVAAGDTLYIEGSSTPYGGPAGIYKPLTFIGPGYFLSENDSTQHNKSSATINSFIIGPGAEGSVLCGLNLIASSWNQCGLHINTGNVLVKNCHIYGLAQFSVLIQAASNVILQQCYIDGNQHQGIYIYTGCQNIVIQNNYITTSWDSFSIFMEDGTSADVINNIIRIGHLRILNGTFRNNIYCENNHGWTFINMTVTNNIDAGAHYSCINGNQCNVDMNTVFICWNDCTGRTSDDKFMLLPAGVAVGAGYGGVDCGMFDGPAPYSLSGLTNIPAIWEMSVSGVNVTVKAKSH